MDVVCYPDPILQRRAAPVDLARPDLAEIVEEMIKTMIEAAGVGLAGPQVALDLRLFVASATGEAGDVVVCINPQVELSGPLVEMEEGCLSLPGIRRIIKRPSEIRLRAFNVGGEEFEVTDDGLLGRILQHENDHLNGVLFFERMTGADRIGIRPDLKALEEQHRPGETLRRP
ncbi:MAG: peptide deformylase [Planctomycetota bacterium]|nr:peptide deformylase [Planctomycetota bacterium]